MIETLFIVGLVAMVVVYQTDIRRLLERAFAGRPANEPAAGVADVVAEAAGVLATQRTGGLIALRGREPWAAYQQGGVELGAAISVPLVCSVFDPHSPGHDGALLVEGDRATRFAVHLPLATQPPDVSRFGGTRHAAALGLAEACDALVVVVSEETGAISVAEQGRLETLAGPDVLVARLRDFHRRLAGFSGMVRDRRSLSPTLQTAVAALGLSTVLWLALVYSPDTVLRSFDLPIAVRNLPSDWTIRQPLPPTVRVDLTGAEQRLRNLDAESLTVALDLSQPARGARTITLGAANLALPPGIDVRGMEPAALSLDLQQTRVVSVPVVVPIIGTPPEGLVLVRARATTPTANLVVPLDEDPPTRVLTQVLDLRSVTGDATAPSRLVPPAGFPLAEGANVEVTIDIDVREVPSQPPGAM